MDGRPIRALCLVISALALALAGCSRPTPRVGETADTAAAAQAPDMAIAAADPAESQAPDGPPIPSTRRDERTLRQDHPYRDHHGAADCLEDCSAHEAGYKWAALHSLDDERLCAGRTRGFVEGCRAYVGDHRG